MFLLSGYGYVGELLEMQETELNMKQWTSPKLGKEYVKAIYCHSVYLTFMQST